MFTIETNDEEGRKLAIRACLESKKPSDQILGYFLQEDVDTTVSVLIGKLILEKGYDVHDAALGLCSLMANMIMAFADNVEVIEGSPIQHVMLRDLANMVQQAMNYERGEFDANVQQH